MNTEPPSADHRVRQGHRRKRKERALQISLLALISFLLLRCGAEGTPGSEQYLFEVRVGESLLQFCERVHSSGGPSCQNFEEAAQSFSDDESLFPIVPAGDLPVKKKAMRHFLRFEGHFVPGKHTVRRKSDSNQQSKEILSYMLLKSAQRLREIAGSDAPDDPRLQSLNAGQRIILASIVEKEAVSNQDYEKVASVFLNRLSKGQVLGSCPTVEYGLGYHRPFLLFKDLELQSDYNVYKRAGLPPGPVAQFSDAAYKAVLNPARTNDIFFVYDWTTGKLHFAEEYRDHKKNAAIARSNFIQRYTKAPMYKRFDNLYYEDLPESDYPKAD